MNAFFIFLVSFAAGVIIIFALLKISRTTHFLVDVPENDALKIHTKHIPLIGGLAIMASVVLTAAVFFYSPIMAVLLAILPVFFLGFYDDAKWKHVSTIKPFLKFALLLACTLAPSIILSYGGIRFNFIPHVGISILLGFAYIFVVINAVNYQDGMDALAGGEVFISLLGFSALALAAGNALALFICVVLLGAVLAFLVFNFSPAKIFMGDSGAYSLGCILAVLAMLFSKPYDFYGVLGPVFIIGLPIFDGVFTNIRRLAAGKSIFLGDRSHMYDKLLQQGFSTKKTLAICYGLQVALVVIGLIIYK